MNRHHRMSRLAFITLGSLAITLGLASLASSEASAATTKTVCPTGVTTCSANNATCNYNGGSGLQSAIDNATSGTTIELCSGVYRNWYSTKKVTQTDHNRCGDHDYTTSFLVDGKTDLVIRAAGSLQAKDVVILGDHEHALTLNASTRVRISRVSLVAQGSTMSNGIGDASLNVHNSSGLLEKSIVTYNHTNSNRAVWYSVVSDVAEELNDQEGIELSGPDTYFEIYDNIIANNLHNGIIAIDGADAFVVKNLVYNNGHYGHFETNHSGQGINVFHDRGEQQFCGPQDYYDPDHALKAWNNVIENNTGHGIILRGWYPQVGVDIANDSLLRRDGKLTSTDQSSWTTNFMDQLAHNRIRNNGKSGIRLGHWWSYKQSSTTHGSVAWLQGSAQIQISDNDIAFNTGDTPRPAGIYKAPGQTWPAGPKEGGGLQLDDIAIWADSSARVKLIDNNWARNGESLGLPQVSYPSHVSSRVDNYTSNTELDPAPNQANLDQREIGAYFASSRPWAVFDASAHPSVQNGSYATAMSALATRLASEQSLTHWIERAPETKDWCKAQPDCTSYYLCTNKNYCTGYVAQSIAPDP